MMNTVVAVSGGIDSMVLLDMLVHNRCDTLQVEPENLIVAHVNHGIRTDSNEDELLVKEVAEKHGLQYESIKLKLAAETSEEQAREARYNFLRQNCKKHKAQLVTAHHQDDLLETMLINLIRGTGWRGLISLNSNFIMRPLLHTSKAQILSYAKKHAVLWREDSTNQNENYLRNYIRHTLLPKMLNKQPQSIEQLLAINNKVTTLEKEIAIELQKIINDSSHSTNAYTMTRYRLIMLPSSVARELIYSIFTQLDSDWHPNKKQIERALHFVKTGLPGKILEVSGSLKVLLTKREAQFKKS